MTLTRVNGRMITDGTTAVQAFEAGEVDVTRRSAGRGDPAPEGDRGLPAVPGPRHLHYGFNVKTITDVKQRRAMSLAINRREIIDNIAQADQLPRTGWTPQGMPGFDVIEPGLAVAAGDGDLEQAKELMAEVANPKKKITCC